MYKPLLFLGCMHIGFEYADMNYTKKALKWARKSRAGIFVLSDNMEFALPHKGKMMFCQVMPPEKQIESCLKLLGEYKDLIVAGTTGNHVNRAYDVAGVDVDKMIFDKLGLLDKYHAEHGMVDIKSGKQHYKVSFSHGTGVGSDTFRNCKKLLRNYPTSDICVSSHTHKGAHSSEAFFDFDKKGDRFVHKVEFISTGSNLNYPKYAGRELYSPQPKCYVRAWLNAKDHEIKVDTSGIFE